MKFTPISSASAFLSRARRQRYESIPNHENDENDEHQAANEANREAEDAENRSLLHTKLWTLQIKKHQRIVQGALTVIAIAVGCWVATLIYGNLPSESCDSVQQGYNCQPTISKYWGQYSPYYAVPSEISSALPPTCKVTFASILSRHGARDPTLGKSLKYAALIARIHTEATSYGRQTQFLKKYVYSLGADQLTPFGQQQMINSGSKYYSRYSNLAAKHTPFIRAAGQKRVIESAQNWTQGFHQSRMNDETSTIEEEFPYDILIIPETASSNNTLDYSLCTNFLEGHFGEESMLKFSSTFLPPVIARLKTQIKGVEFSNDDMISLMDLCPFHTVSSPTGEVSPFCSLFTASEWQDYDYYQSLGKYYGFEWGNAPLAPTQGVGWTNELIARLTNSPVQDHTSTNSTLDGDEKTFPPAAKVGGLYADFSHDNDMVTIYAAMGLYNATKPLRTGTKMERGGSESEMAGWAAAWTVPFAGRMVVEKMICGEEEDGEAAQQQNPSKSDAKELVRIMVNDRVIPLQNCGADELGRCELGRFVESLSFARRGGEWEKCFD